MTLGEIRTQTYRRLGLEDSPATAVVEMVDGFINETYAEIMGKRQCAKLRRVIPTPSVACTAGDPVLTLPTTVSRIFNLQDRANNIALVKTEQTTIRGWDPNQSMSGVPTHFAPIQMVVPIKLHLFPVPDSVITYHFDADAEFTRLTTTGAVPLLPAEFHDMLSIGARSKYYERREKEKLKQSTDREFQIRLLDLYSWIHANPSPPQSSAGMSQLGPWFPAGS